jgi:hypothetical protein
LYKIWISNSNVHTRSANASSAPVDPLAGVPEEYHDFADVFSKQKAQELSEHRPYDLKIELEEGATPPSPGHLYSLSTLEQETLQMFIQENLSFSFICPSKSGHGAPVVFAKKKDGSLHLCCDFHGLNKITKKDDYPLPLINDLLDTSHKGCLYTKIDLHHVYHLVCLADGEESKTTFRMFEWLLIPEGLMNTPAAFQRFMNNIFSDMLDISVIVYLNDILVYSNGDLVEHRTLMCEVLCHLCKHKLFAKVEKCAFHSDTVKYLGYILTPEGLTMDPAKVEMITLWPVPHKVKDLQSFLGFVNFYHHFIWNYSDICVPLMQLMCKTMDWKWTSTCQEVFNCLKTMFTTAPILMSWLPDMLLLVETDTSDYVLAAILSTHLPDREIHPIAFHSHTFCGTELNYNIHDKELLTIFEAFKTWCHYLEGAGDPIDVITNHKNLEYFATTKVLTQCQVHWSEFLSAFNLVIHFCPGRLGAKPDTLTRQWDIYPKEGRSDYASVNPHNFHPVSSQE